MKFKLDENLDARLAVILSAEGHEVSHVVAQGLGGHPDEQIYAFCIAEKRALVTLDLDFANPLRFPATDTAGIIVLRPPRPLLSLIRRLVESLPRLLRRERLEGRLWIVEPERLRIFSPPGEDSSSSDT